MIDRLTKEELGIEQVTLIYGEKLLPSEGNYLALHYSTWIGSEVKALCYSDISKLLSPYAVGIDRAESVLGAALPSLNKFNDTITIS